MAVALRLDSRSALAAATTTVAATTTAATMATTEPSTVATAEPTTVAATKAPATTKATTAHTAKPGMESAAGPHACNTKTAAWRKGGVLSKRSDATGSPAGQQFTPRHVYGRMPVFCEG